MFEKGELLPGRDPTLPGRARPCRLPFPGLPSGNQMSQPSADFSGFLLLTHLKETKCPDGLVVRLFDNNISELGPDDNTFLNRRQTLRKS